MALVTTVGGASSDSYVTLTEADNYFAAHPKAAQWTAVGSDANKEMLLKMSARHLDLLNYWGDKIFRTQALKFPRLYKSIWVLPATIPSQVKYAQMEHALELAPVLASSGAVTKREQLQKQGVKSFSLGDLTETFTDESVEKQSSFSTSPLRFFGPDSLIYLNGIILRGVRNKNYNCIEDSNYSNCNCD